MDSRTLVVSCEADKELHGPLLALGFTIYSNELILTSLLRQRLQLDL